VKNFKLYMESEDKVKLFKERTTMHIGLVQKYAKKIAVAFPELKQVVSQAKNHDKSKMSNPEFDAYVEITWYYKQKSQGIDVEYDSNLNDATFHHVKHNSHHPEYHDPKATSKVINTKDRDKPSGVIVDASSMPKIDMAEMCADLCAMANELGGTP